MVFSHKRHKGHITQYIFAFFLRVMRKKQKPKKNHIAFTHKGHITGEIYNSIQTKTFNNRHVHCSLFNVIYPDLKQR